MKDLIEKWEARKIKLRYAARQRYKTDLTNKIAIAMEFELDRCIKELKDATEDRA